MFFFSFSFIAGDKKKKHGINLRSKRSVKDVQPATVTYNTTQCLIRGLFVCPNGNCGRK